ncbi:transcription factor Ouib [Drosophila mauritiana]|uniref:Transcription factor Ouib n=1 Tax=Drosophila mauritiana TaxID=7226 RepID=A0A6P8KQD3_DROMA|nr:transcription factor Ouib [Drosophila mauritiana]
MLQNVCRVCASSTDNSKSLKLFNNGARKVLQQINLLTGVLLQCEPDLPDWMCETCQADLNNAISFRDRCLSSQKIFEESLIRTEEATSRSSVRRSARSQRLRHEDTAPKTPASPLEVMIKLESLSNGDEEDDGIDHLDSCNEADMELAIKAMSSTSEDDETTSPVRLKRTRRRGLKKGGKGENRSKVTLPVFFCDQCGNNITGKSSFDRHLRKHSGIRPFQCELCPARFLSSGELKGHQVMHTGDRKFQCRYCDRTYVNYSGRLRHERTHTNDRPFICAQCGKSFTNSYILKNHMLIHTGERLFRCELCHRSFARPTHLKTHFRSNTHKHNVEKSKADAGGVQLSPSQSADQVKFVTEKEADAEADAFTIEVPLPAEQEQDESLGLAALETSTLMYSTN